MKKLPPNAKLDLYDLAERDWILKQISGNRNIRSTHTLSWDELAAKVEEKRSELNLQAPSSLNNGDKFTAIEILLLKRREYLLKQLEHCPRKKSGDTSNLKESLIPRSRRN